MVVVIDIVHFLSARIRDTGQRYDYIETLY